MASVFKRGGKSNRNGYWYIAWFDHTGKRRTQCAKTTDKATAERIARKREADTALRRDGVVDAALEGISRESERSIESHLSDYENKMKAANRSTDYVARKDSEFLKPTNDVGERFDFHSLRHTCGAWLAMSGAHPKVIQAVMRHSAITLTMDTYGHLFPGQEADAVAGMGA